MSDKFTQMCYISGMELFLITLALMLIFFVLMGVKTLLIDKPLQKSCGNAPLLVNGVRLADCECDESGHHEVQFKEEEHLCIECPNKDTCTSDPGDTGLCGD